jgi:hypothetical protein
MSICRMNLFQDGMQTGRRMTFQPTSACRPTRAEPKERLLWKAAGIPFHSRPERGSNRPKEAIERNTRALIGEPERDEVTGYVLVRRGGRLSSRGPVATAG